MNVAINVFYEIFRNLIVFVFNKMEIVEGVTVGWVLIVVIVFGILLGSLINVPKRAQSINVNRKDGN